MSIGYACIHIGSENIKLSSIRIKNATKENLRNVISRNLDALEAIIRYNINNKIGLFRISSDIIPLGSHPANTIKWWAEFEDRLKEIGDFIDKSRMRVSMHPGQYTVLNSIRKDVVEKSIDDLAYHCKFLDSLECDSSAKIILHIGGVYQDKAESIERFINIYQSLNQNIKDRLVIENDDKSYNIDDVLSISKKIRIPVVFDNLHHRLNNAQSKISEYEWIDICEETWKPEDGKQKIHYSQKSKDGKRGAHSNSIIADEFMQFYNGLVSKDIDIMLEVKDKNLSAVKCNLLLKKDVKSNDLENEWTKYKYLVLSRSSDIYHEIRDLLKDKANPDVIRFYTFIESALSLKENIGAEINAAQHVWGYVNKKASASEKKRFELLIDRYQNGEISAKTIKAFLFKLAKVQSVDYLVKSLYFYI